MLIEQLIFTVVAFALFVYMFFKMIKTNDTSYVIFLILEAIGIALNFTDVLFAVKLNTFFKIIMYIFSIIIPLIIIILEKANINIIEQLHITNAMFHFHLGNNKKAKQILISLLDKNPYSYKAHKLLAQIYENEGGMRKAIDEYVQAIDLNKKDYDAYYKVANLLGGLDKKNEATQMLTNLLNKKPDYTEASILLGDLLIEQQMYKEAANVYIEALKYNEVSFELNYNLGIVYTMLNDFQSAKEYYEKAAQINSLVYNSKYSLAEIALIYKELDEAEKKFLETIDDEELAPDAYYELAKIHLIKGDKDTAIKYANIAIDLNPKKIVPKIKSDTAFILILGKLSMPFNIESENENEEKTKLKPKEIKSKKHLEEMVDITRELSYNDIRLLNQNKTSKNGIEFKQNEQSNIKDNQKEIQE